MASWFYASEGKQQGPYPDGQFRDLIAQGVVRADTLVWTEGMAGWQKAGEIPGLLASSGNPPSLSEGRDGYGGGALSLDFGIWEFVWRGFVLLLGLITIIPAPWAIVWYLKWIVSKVEVPRRPNLSFTGRALTFAGWYFGFIVLLCLQSPSRRSEAKRWTISWASCKSPSTGSSSVGSSQTSPPTRCRWA